MDYEKRLSTGNLFFAIHKQGFYDREAWGKLHKENFIQRQEHSFRLSYAENNYARV